MKNTLLLAAILGLGLTPLHAQGSTTDANSITMPLVTVGDPGNLADTNTALGAVAAPYQIGTYDVTATQYSKFLNAVASNDDKYGVYNPMMSSSPFVGSIDCTTNNDGIVSYAPKKGMGDFPIVYVSLYSAMRFCNWLHNGSPSSVAATNAAITETGAYTFSYDFKNNTTSAALATDALWFLPSKDQWYKAAYEQASNGDTSHYYWNYPTCSDFIPSSLISDSSSINAANYAGFDAHYNCVYTDSTPPYLTPVGLFSNAKSPWGAYDMAGNVCQWIGTLYTVTSPTGSVSIVYPALGGSWKSVGGMLSRHPIGNQDIYDPSQGYETIGFRVAAPVPSN